jgi:capsular exopolysaccharide synthesis family protein
MSNDAPAAHEVASPPSTGDDIIDLRQYAAMLLRRRWVILPVFLAVILGTLVYTVRQPKVYQAVCTIIIESAAPRVLDAQQVQDVVESGAGGWVSRDYYETQYKILTSRAVATRVSERLGLASNLRFLGLESVKDPAEQERLRSAADAVGAVQRRLRVEPIKDSRVVRLVVEDGDPELAAVIANAFADAYVTESLAVRSTTTQNASVWLEQQLADLEVKLETSGRALFEFKERNDIVSTSWEDRQSMVSQRLTTINEALVRAKVERAQLQARAEAIDNVLAAMKRGETGSLESLPGVTASVTVQALKAKYYEARAECSGLATKYLEDHPALLACTERVELSRANLEREIRNMVDSARQHYEEVRLTEKNLQALYDGTKTDAFGLNQYEREYVELKRAYDNNQRLYDVVLKRLKDAGLSGMLEMSNVRILDRARPSMAPVRPSVRRNLVAAVMMGILAGVALALLVEALDNTVRTPPHVEALGLPFLGVLPRVEPEEGAPIDLVVHTDPKSPVAECCRSIRTNILFMSPERPVRTLLVTSSGPEEGKTTTALDIAITMAEGGSRVLLVDGDMRRPRVHKALDLPNGSGLSALVLGETRLEEVVRTTRVPNLFAVTCGAIPPKPAELLQTHAFARLLAQMARDYDRVVIDSPPVSAVSDATIISTQVDGTILVVKASRTTRQQLRHSFRVLADVNARVLGAVLNHVDVSAHQYAGYYYAYGYVYGERPADDARQQSA